MSAAIQKRWSASELSVLEARVAANVSPALIAQELGRSLPSVNSRRHIAHKRKRDAQWRSVLVKREQIEPQFVVPPSYVLRERDIRWSIPPHESVSAVIFNDPVEGYSALATKARKISVQDALEICALYTGRRGERVALAASYSVSPNTIDMILNGSFFERLLPLRIPRRKGDD